MKPEARETDLASKQRTHSPTVFHANGQFSDSLNTSAENPHVSADSPNGDEVSKVPSAPELVANTIFLDDGEKPLPNIPWEMIQEPLQSLKGDAGGSCAKWVDDVYFEGTKIGSLKDGTCTFTYLLDLHSDKRTCKFVPVLAIALWSNLRSKCTGKDPNHFIARY